MKTPKFKTCIVASVAIALAWLALPYASADVITLNFDSVDASTTPWKVDATAYLNANGITLSNVSDPGTVYIASDFQSGNFMYPSSQHNFLYQAVGGAPPCSYTLDFSTPLQSISFTRVGDGGNASTPTWSATAYVGAAAVGSVGDSYISAYIGQGPRTYTLSGYGITSLTISANGNHFSASSSPGLDDLVLTPLSPVPQGQSYSNVIPPLTTSGSLPTTVAIVDGTATAPAGETVRVIPLSSGQASAYALQSGSSLSLYTDIVQVSGTGNDMIVESGRLRANA